MPWVVRAVGPEKQPTCTATAGSRGHTRSDPRGQRLTIWPDKQSNQVAVEDVRCCGAGRQCWSRGAGSEGEAYDRFNTRVWSVALVTRSRMRV